ncbi:hypothetical protein G7Y89_g1000 [Cudoniella acicularis]|uniref:Uncharacterized protein n=1 Tax=Cudoniella acicularis TaxID=354080 RepID=A0A8H4RX69_9HELO|nr:hypothetical protein G7Y89_g1000 [Cudoniella acicularis]
MAEITYTFGQETYTSRQAAIFRYAKTHPRTQTSETGAGTVGTIIAPTRLIQKIKAIEVFMVGDPKTSSLTEPYKQWTIDEWLIEQYWGKEVKAEIGGMRNVLVRQVQDNITNTTVPSPGNQPTNPPTRVPPPGTGTTTVNTTSTSTYANTAVQPPQQTTQPQAQTQIVKHEFNKSAYGAPAPFKLNPGQPLVEWIGHYPQPGLNNVGLILGALSTYRPDAYVRFAGNQNEYLKTFNRHFPGIMVRFAKPADWNRLPPHHKLLSIWTEYRKLPPYQSTKKAKEALD